MGIRKMAAVLCAKVICRACKIAGKQGVTLAGKIAMRIDPDILRDLAAQVREKIFVTCGTNGKTTTNNLLCSAIEAERKKVVCNRIGSNMLNGVAAAFALSAGLTGKLDADYACIEIDEASSVRVFPYFKPDYMILTNLSRDQLDRYGEIDITMNILTDACHMAPEMTVIVNGDDPLSYYLAKNSGNKFVTFGIGSDCRRETASEAEIREGRFCKVCGKPLHYDFYHFAQLGAYSCTCGFCRPALDFDAQDVDTSDGLAFTVGQTRICARYRGFYNIYNILAAYAGARTCGLELAEYGRVLADYHPQNGRMESFLIDGTHIILNLAKNPAGFNQNLSAVMEDDAQKDIIIVINDNSADGTDVSWLWDVDFDRLAQANAASITVSGIRCRDMQLRLKYVDIASSLQPDVETAIRDKIRNGVKNLYVLVNYTGLYNTHVILKRLEEAQS